jgi:tetratricopeptide (TPR) repeat protein
LSSEARGGKLHYAGSARFSQDSPSDGRCRPGEQVSDDETTDESGAISPGDDSDEGNLSQDELDALIAEAEQEFEEAGGAGEEYASKSLLSQEDLDAAVAAASADTTSGAIFSVDEFSGEPPAIEKEPIEDPEVLSMLMGTSSETPSEDASPDRDDAEGLSDQAQVDAFIEEAASSATVPPVAENQGPIEQDELDVLMASADSILAAQKPKEEVGPPVDKSVRPEDFMVVEDDEGPLSQDDIDALMNPVSDTPDSVEPTEGDASETPEAETSESDGGALGQNEIDALMASASGDAPEDTGSPEENDTDASDTLEMVDADASEETTDAEIAESDDGALGQSEIDALMASASGDTAEDTGTPEEIETEAGSLDQSEIDALMSGDQPAGEDTDAELVETSDELVGSDMEERLDAETPSEESIAHGHGDAAPTGEPTAPDQDAPAEEPPAETPDAAVDEDSVAAVATENAAAGAVESQEVDMPPPSEAMEPAMAAPAAPEYEKLDALGADAEGEITASPRRPIVSGLVEDPYRLITGLAAGILVAVSAALYMTANLLQDPPDFTGAAISIGQGDVERQLALTREYVDEKDYTRAINLLDAIIPAAQGSPMEMDARYLRLEAKYHTLPDRLPTRMANALHSEIDALVERAPMHPRKPHALFWKGQIYEKEGNILAARAEYRELLRNDANADNRDEVLMALADLELRTDRPIQAARYLQQLRRNHADSPLAQKAQLMLGDAYAAAGDDEQARNLYIRLAQNNPGNKIGGQAFAKLGKLAYDTGNYDRAIEDLEARLQTATTVEGNDAVTLMLAKSYRAAGRLEDAQNTLQGLLDFFPESDITPLAAVEFSRVLAESGQMKSAVRYATQAAQRFPDNPDVLRNAGEMLAKSGDAREAARALLAADAAGANDPELLLAAGKLYREGGATKKARHVLTRLTNEFPNTEQGFLGNLELSRVLYAEGQPTKAVGLLSDLVRTTTSPVRRLQLLGVQGKMYDAMGLPLKVAEVYSEIAFMTEEPDMLAKAALALMKNRQYDEGLTVAARVDVPKLSPQRAYAFLNAEGRAMLLKTPRKGLELLEQAHTAYPAERTAKDVQTLLEANLSLGRNARARAIVAELQTEDARDPLSTDRLQLERAAITWGDYLFERKDYRGAVDAYSTALGLEDDAGSSAPDETATAPPESESRQWARYQLANAHFNLSNYAASLTYYDQLAQSTSTWASEAEAKSRTARLELRLQGRPVPETRNAG